ncbi:MAG: hypothetical protein H0V44_12765 [Planctomycetes bacterium]|nr:hypothetical protein [Planctomycetota bacterium]
MSLDHLDDASAVRLVPVDPPLEASAWVGLADALGKLFEQFVREGRVGAWGIDLAAQGAIVVLAWTSVETLSGCSHDKIARLLALHEERSGCRLLSAPPIVMDISGRIRCLDRTAVRKLVAAKQVTRATPAYDLRVETLGAWRTHGRRPVGETSIATLIARFAEAT